MDNKELRTNSSLRIKNLDLYLYLKLCFDIGKTYDEIKKDYSNSLDKITSSKKDIKLKMNRLYNVYYTQFRNRELEKKGIVDYTIDPQENDNQLNLFEINK